jgi:putative two-component system response regulator
MLSKVQSSFRLLSVGDERFTTEFLVTNLEPFGYEVLTVSSGQAALDIVQTRSIDLVVADALLPDMDGVRLCIQLKRNPATHLIPILLMTHEDDRDNRVRGLTAGADDFIVKPMDEIELRARIRSLLRLRTLQQRLQNERALLEVRLRERTREIESVNLGLVAALEKASELNDEDTGAHILRVCATSELLARTIGMQDGFCEKVRRYASLHDIGKVGVPDEILKKRGSLTPVEWETMRKHTVFGYELLRTANADAIAQNIAWCHHEKFDGTGYPRGLKGKDIPIEARLVAISDVFDALVSKRCYKDAIPIDTAVEMVVAQSCRHFDPDIVQAFRMRLPEILQIQDAYRTTSEGPLEAMPQAPG